jgi:hypothetical protein
MLFSPLLVPQAYLDPGSGSILIQLILAVLLGFGVFVRAQWSRIRKLFGKKDADQDDIDSKE